MSRISRGESWATRRPTRATPASTSRLIDGSRSCPVGEADEQLVDRREDVGVIERRGQGPIGDRRAAACSTGRLGRIRAEVEDGSGRPAPDPAGHRGIVPWGDGWAEDRQIRRIRLERLDHVLAGHGGGHVIAVAAQPVGEQHQPDWIAVDDEQARRAHRGSG